MADIKEFIIDRPESLRIHHKVTALSLTFIFWFITFYLWQPLISLIAWALGFEVFYQQMIVEGGFKGFIDLVLIYGGIIVSLGIGFLLWAKVNQWRFRGKEKRTQPVAINAQQVADYFQIDYSIYQEWAEQKNITLLVENRFKVHRIM